MCSLPPLAGAELLRLAWVFCCSASVPCPHCCLTLTGESIPIRLFLAGYELTPTMRDINKKFSVRYYLNLVLIDEEERRYFKQQVGVSSRTLGTLGHNTERPLFSQRAILILKAEC